MERLQSLPARVFAIARREDGQEMAEYALIIALLSIVAIVALVALSGTLSTAWTTIASRI